MRALACALLASFGVATGELVVAMSNVSSNVAICPEGASECQLNLHYVHWVVPTNSTSTGISTSATATYTYADGSHSMSKSETVVPPKRDISAS